MPIPAQILRRDDVFAGQPALTVDDAIDRVRRFERRDQSALGGLSGDAMNLAYYRESAARLNAHEWGIAREAKIVDPECILVAGGKDGVAWGDFLAAGLVPIAHSHPLHGGNAAKTRLIAGGAVLWDDINGVNPNQNLAERLRIFPSAGDAEFCSANNIATHRVETPYVVVYNQGQVRYIANPNAHPAFGTAPRLNFIIDATAMDHGPAHTRISLTAFEGTRPFWSKPNIGVSGHRGDGLHF